MSVTIRCLALVVAVSTASILSAATTEPPQAKATPPSKPSGIPAPADVAAPPADAQKTASGLASKILKPGTGAEHPLPWDTAEVHYTGWTTDGQMFDSTVTRGQTKNAQLSRLIPGLRESVQLMVVGEKRRSWIPQDLAYGGHAGAPMGMLVFDVELFAISRGMAPPPVPEDVAAPPAGTKSTASGIAYRVLKAGAGTVHPTRDTMVSVHYSGWTSDGTMFDSSVTRNRPQVTSLSGAIPGWTEGLQLMVAGEKTRFWIPKSLAFGDDGTSGNTLCFDIELLEILP